MPQEPLIIDETTDPEKGYRILRVKGPIVISNLFDLQNRVRSSTAPALILDLTDVPYVDSAGVGVLVGAYVTHQKDGRSLALVGVNNRVRTTLGITRVESFFRFFDSAAAAEQTASSLSGVATEKSA
ncbi:MAG TPA: STAS domain-containing protein [Terriglobales bacterium]|nr:STAS domain-containing protein [Terriglobales bacterium]